MVTSICLHEVNGSVFKVRQLSSYEVFSSQVHLCGCRHREKESWTMKSKLIKEKRTQDREVRGSRKVVGFMDYGFQ